MLQNKNIKSLIFIIILLLLLGGLVYYLFGRSKPVVNKNLNINIEALEFKVMDESLPEWKRDDYFNRFLAAKSVLGQNPDAFNSWMELGGVYKGIGDYKTAEEIWIYAGIIRPKNSVSFNNLGDLYTRFLPDYEKAEQNYIIAIQNSQGEPFNILYYRNLYELYRYYFKERAELADDVLLQGIADNPRNVELVVLLATYYKEIGDKENAILYFQEALGLNLDKSTENEIKKELENLGT